MSLCILSVGRNPHLMTIRTLLLQGAGYVVDEAYEPSDALSGAQCDCVDVLLICHTVPNSERRWLIANVARKEYVYPYCV
jgi:hypothetical protein